MKEDSDPLCCCEYVNVHGKRAHLCGLCCDCSELDDMFDKLLTGSRVQDQRYHDVLKVAEDRFRIPWPGGARPFPVDIVSPWILVPLLFNLASYNLYTQILVTGMTMPLIVFCKYRTCLRAYRPDTKFFASWSLATFAYIFYIYEFQVVGIISLPKTVSPMENFVLIGFLFASGFFLFKTRSFNHQGLSNDQTRRPPKYCKVCRDTIPGKDHHCVWIDACIADGNLINFVGFLAFLILALFQASMILLTSVCLPLDVIQNKLVVPQLWCQRWNNHFEGDLRLTFTAGLHCLILTFLILILFLSKLVTLLKLRLK